MFQFLKKITSPFARLKSTLGQKIKGLFSQKPPAEAFEELERLLYEADLGASLSSDIVEAVRAWKKNNSPETELLPFVKAALLKLFPPAPTQTLGSPHVILVVGVNGSGKTTSLAKLGKRYRDEGKKVIFGAADTFRAAAVEQLESWAAKLGVDLVKGQPGGDPAAVAFDTAQATLARKGEVALIDTAGRLQNRTDLMQELAKVRRALQKAIPGAPHETLLVLDATLGQNALDQARIFHQFTPLTGIILTKLDGSAKGGIAAAIQQQLKIPILWTGLGEGEEDLIPFNAEEYLDALLEN